MEVFVVIAFDAEKRQKEDEQEAEASLLLPFSKKWPSVSTLGHQLFGALEFPGIYFPFVRDDEKRQ